MTKRKTKPKPAAKPAERWFTLKGKIASNAHQNGTHVTWRMTSEKVGRFWRNGRDMVISVWNLSSLVNDPDFIELNPATGQPFGHEVNPKPVDWQARALAAEAKLAQIKEVCND